jgi:type VI secretion system protein ImpG
MIDHLFPYYERELRYVNLLAQEFARNHPQVAHRLGLEITGSSDPYVQRLLETFALLAGRAHAKIDDEFPEVTDALLAQLYPHFLAPIPSTAVVQFEVDPTRLQLPAGFVIPAGSVLEAATEPVPCRYRTVYPATLWPVRLERASFRVPPFPAELKPPTGAVAALHLELECVGELSFDQLQLDALRFFLAGDPQMVPDLYEVLLNHALEVVFVADRSAGPRSPVALAPKACLRGVGFEKDEGLLPYPDAARMGYRLLTEFFTCPTKFQFIDLGGWRRLAGARLGRRCTVFIFCAKTLKTLEAGVDTETLRLDCVPAVNLFDKTAEPIPLEPRQTEYRIVADRMARQAIEVYSVTNVSSSNPAQQRTTEYAPFFALAHTEHGRGRGLFWYTTRQRSLAENDSGTEVDIALVNLGFESRWPADEMLEVQLLCTNRDLPLRLAAPNARIAWSLQLPAPVTRVQCLRPPAPPLRPAMRRGRPWEIVAHLSPSPLALEDGHAGRAALRDILRLYDFSDPAAGQRHLKDQAQQIVEGVLEVGYRRVLGRVPSDPTRGLCRGVEVTVELDPTKFPGRGAYLFAAVLDRFLGLFATTNSFTELVARTSQAVIKKWPARTGEIPLV